MTLLKENNQKIIKNCNKHIPTNFSCDEIHYTYKTSWDYNKSADRLFFSILCSYKGKPISDHSCFYLDGLVTFIRYRPHLTTTDLNRVNDNFIVVEITGIIINDWLKFKRIQDDSCLNYIMKTKIIVDYNNFKQKLEEKINDNDYKWIITANDKNLLNNELKNKWDYIINANKFDLI